MGRPSFTAIRQHQPSNEGASPTFHRLDGRRRRPWDPLVSRRGLTPSHDAASPPFPSSPSRDGHLPRSPPPFLDAISQPPTMVTPPLELSPLRDKTGHGPSCQPLPRPTSSPRRNLPATAEGSSGITMAKMCFWPCVWHPLSALPLRNRAEPFDRRHITKIRAQPSMSPAIVGQELGLYKATHREP